MPRPKNSFKVDGQEIQKRREAMDLTQEGFIALSDVSFSLSTLQRLEASAPVSRKTAYEVADALGVDISQIEMTTSEAQPDNERIVQSNERLISKRMKKAISDDVFEDYNSFIDGLLGKILEGTPQRWAGSTWLWNAISEEEERVRLAQAALRSEDVEKHAAMDNVIHTLSRLGTSG